MLRTVNKLHSVNKSTRQMMKYNFNLNLDKSIGIILFLAALVNFNDVNQC